MLEVFCRQSRICSNPCNFSTSGRNPMPSTVNYSAGEATGPPCCLPHWLRTLLNGLYGPESLTQFYLFNLTFFFSPTFILCSNLVFLFTSSSLSIVFPIPCAFNVFAAWILPQKWIGGSLPDLIQVSAQISPNREVSDLHKRSFTSPSASFCPQALTGTCIFAYFIFVCFLSASSTRMQVSWGKKFVHFVKYYIANTYKNGT